VCRVIDPDLLPFALTGLLSTSPIELFSLTNIFGLFLSVEET
jgi:hypothetical protein